MQGSSVSQLASPTQAQRVVADHIDRLILVDLDYALQAAMVPIQGFSDRPGLPMVVADVFNLGAPRAAPRDDF